jgi:hypothetical protein
MLHELIEFCQKVDKTRRLWGEISIQDRVLCSWVLTNFEINLAPSLINFVRQAVPVPLVFLNYYIPGLLFADFGDAKTLVRWTLNHIGQLSFISWRCWVYLPVPSPRFLLFGRWGGVTLVRFSYFPSTSKCPSTFSLQRYYLKTLPLTSCSILKILYSDYINNGAVAATMTHCSCAHILVHSCLSAPTHGP